MVGSYQAPCECMNLLLLPQTSRTSLEDFVRTSEVHLEEYMGKTGSGEFERLDAVGTGDPPRHGRDTASKAVRCAGSGDSWERLGQVHTRGSGDTRGTSNRLEECSAL